MTGNADIPRGRDDKKSLNRRFEPEISAPNKIWAQRLVKINSLLGVDTDYPISKPRVATILGTSPSATCLLGG